ncbi:MAG: thioredoxin [Alphaproteobacteria bacterium]|jgi:putative thioredoxin|nr:thioredoxin [Alphaproteobacteria bacterium]
MEPIIGAGPAGPGQGDVIKSTDTAGFKADVLDASMTVPVIVDFWAPWCQPCKQLTPLLEKAVQAAKGAVRLAKINIDENQQLAAQMRIQSIPTVVAFFEGRPVDYFQGALPESQLKRFVDKLAELSGAGAGSPVEEALDQADGLMQAGEAQAAAGIFGQVLEHDPTSTRAAAGLMKAMVQLGHVERARAVLDSLPDEVAGDPAIASARSAIELAEAGAAGASEIGRLESALAADPADHQARLDLAMALYGSGNAGRAIDELLEIIRQDRDWNEQAARKQLLKLFEALGPTDPVVLAARRRLSSLLFS